MLRYQGANFLFQSTNVGIFCFDFLSLLRDLGLELNDVFLEGKDFLIEPRLHFLRLLFGFGM